MKMILKTKKLFKYLFIAILITLVFVIILNLNQTDPYIIVQENNFEQDSNNIIFEPDRLVNLKGFKYLISSNICKKYQDTYNKTLLGILIVTSYVGHDNVRSAHRAAISEEDLFELGLLRVFLISKIPEKEKFITQEQIDSEQKRYHDLIQGNFFEAYRNLTYKHIMGLKWAATECNNAKFIVKIDDDTVFDVFYLKNYLENFNVYYHFDKRKDNNFIAGYILDHKDPIRIIANKWFVTYEEYPKSTYPEYVSGWFYITTTSAAKKIILQSQIEKFFWIDDTFATGIIREKLSIPLIRLNNWFSANSEFLDCCIQDVQKLLLKCEYFVGPNGGDTKLIEKFVKGLRKCYKNEMKCVKRPENKTLKETCVGFKKNILNDHGEGLVRMVKL